MATFCCSYTFDFASKRFAICKSLVVEKYGWSFKPRFYGCVVCCDKVHWPIYIKNAPCHTKLCCSALKLSVLNFNAAASGTIGELQTPSWVVISPILYVSVSLWYFWFMVAHIPTIFFAATHTLPQRDHADDCSNGVLASEVDIVVPRYFTECVINIFINLLWDVPLLQTPSTSLLWPLDLGRIQKFLAVCTISSQDWLLIATH